MKSCNRIAPELARYLVEGRDLSRDAVEHLRECSDCAATVRRAQLLGELLDRDRDAIEAVTSTEVAPLLSQEVTAAMRKRRRLRIALAVAIAATAVFTWYTSAYLLQVRHPTAIWIVQMILFAGPIILLATTTGLDDAAPSPVYKRMRGRQLSGICQGLAEAYRIPVWIVRAAFFGLIFLKGAGVILYFLLDALLPIHPDDRPALLRFRIARWWRQRRMAAA